MAIRLNDVLARYKDAVLNVKEDIKGDLAIQAKQRRELKAAFKDAIKEELSLLVDGSLGEVVENVEGNVIIIAENVEEGNYCVQLEVKVKNLNYDVFEDLAEEG